MHLQTQGPVPRHDGPRLGFDVVGRQVIRPHGGRASLNIRFPGLEVVGGSHADCIALLWCQFSSDRFYNLKCDFRLDIEDVVDGHFSIKRFRPQVLIGCNVDQLGVDADALAGTLDAAFQNDAYTQFIGNLGDLFGGVAVLHH